MTTAKGSAPGWVKLLQSALIFSQKLAGAGVRTPTSAFDALVVGCRPRIGHLPTIASFSNPPHRVGMGTSPTPNAHAPRSVCMCNRSFRTSGDFQGFPPGTRRTYRWQTHRTTTSRICWVARCSCRYINGWRTAAPCTCCPRAPLPTSSSSPTRSAPSTFFATTRSTTRG